MSARGAVPNRKKKKIKCENSMELQGGGRGKDEAQYLRELSFHLRDLHVPDQIKHRVAGEVMRPVVGFYLQSLTAWAVRWGLLAGLGVLRG